MYPLNRQPIPNVHVRAAKSERGSIPVDLNDQKTREIQGRFEYEVRSIQHGMTQQIPSGDSEDRCRYLRRELFVWSLRRLRHDYNDKAFLSVVSAAVVIYVISAGFDLSANWRLMINGLCFTTFTWVAYQIFSLWFRAYKTSATPNPLQIEHPAIEAKEIESKSGLGVIRPIEVKIAALKHLLATETARCSPNDTR